jgi:hypothetical protein
MTYVPGQLHKWGPSFDINMQPGPNGRSAGSISWAGLINCCFWLDPVKHVTGALFTQVLPFYDERIVAIDGFNEGWIEFSDNGRSAVKGTTTLDSVIDELVEASRPKPAAQHDHHPVPMTGAQLQGERS